MHPIPGQGAGDEQGDGDKSEEVAGQEQGDVGYGGAEHFADTDLAGPLFGREDRKSE